VDAGQRRRIRRSRISYVHDAHGPTSETARLLQSVSELTIRDYAVGEMPTRVTRGLPGDGRVAATIADVA
jgi:hypothetical protein